MGTLGVQIPGPAQIAKQPSARLRGVACRKNLDMEAPEEDDIAVPGAWAGDLRDIRDHPRLSMRTDRTEGRLAIIDVDRSPCANFVPIATRALPVV
ncbi:hypothetical protein CPLU01_09816 [Colletotrichum plurivorum]|uniref:Uncharacterized protein n=1 Tax=Colletotrichum plurivorum TaxID=2175906 RepID=A0A8H6K7I0_9PEZI|nr:hypothetical protein CPLU01_09816 [Colletotrichum plurivorum]